MSDKSTTQTTIATGLPGGFALGVWWFVWGVKGFWWGVLYGLFWWVWLGYRFAGWLWKS